MVVQKQRATRGTRAVYNAWYQEMEGIPPINALSVGIESMQQALTTLSERIIPSYLKAMSQQQTATTTTRSAAPKKPGGGKKGGKKVQATRGRGTGTRKRSASAGKTASSGTSGGRGRRGSRNSQQGQTATGQDNSIESSNSALH